MLVIYVHHVAQNDKCCWQYFQAVEKLQYTVRDDVFVPAVSSITEG